MIFGAITNSWRQQLDEQELAMLVKEAQTRGARHIELRQTCLGQCEQGEENTGGRSSPVSRTWYRRFPRCPLTSPWPGPVSAGQPTQPVSRSRQRCKGQSSLGGRHRTSASLTPLLSSVPGKSLKTYHTKP